MTELERARLASLPTDPDVVVECDMIGQPHQFTGWEFSPVEVREDRWCLACGVHEIQRIRAR